MTTTGPNPNKWPQAFTTVEDLRCALQTAIEIEHTTVPFYLCARLPRRRRQRGGRVGVHGVVMEEMLHVVLAANVLNAIGGSPDLCHPQFVPRYPAVLPHSNGQVVLSLAPFSPSVIDVALQLEQPEAVGAPPEAGDFDTLGQFYAAIEQGLIAVSAQESIFTGDISRQILPNTFVYGCAGDAIAVYDLDSALAALTLIIDQGEGADQTIHEHDRPLGEHDVLAHWFRLNQIAVGRHYLAEDTPITGPTGPALPVDWNAVRPMRPNPRVADLPPGSEVRAMTEACNQTYGRMLRELHRAFNGEPDVLVPAVALMMDLKWQATALLHVPIDDTGYMAGPSFEVVV